MKMKKVSSTMARLCMKCFKIILMRLICDPQEENYKI